jgi:branched-subunit amino acid transport protein
MAFTVSWSVPHILLACAAFVALILRVDLLWIILAGIGVSLLVR